MNPRGGLLYADSGRGRYHQPRYSSGRKRVPRHRLCQQRDGALSGYTLQLLRRASPRFSFLDPILFFSVLPPETTDYAREFIVIILYGTSVSYVFTGLNNLMRSTG